jgi:hypothetical protein
LLPWAYVSKRHAGPTYQFRRHSVACFAVEGWVGRRRG